MLTLVYGLGNPGRSYRYTRHNISWLVLDAVASRCQLHANRKLFRVLLEEASFQDKKLVLAKPQTYMNLSGEPLPSLLGWYKLMAGDLLVCCDDFNLPLGEIRFRSKGSSGGHNGLASIIDTLKTMDFPRLRIGIGLGEEQHDDKASFVLSEFSPSEKPIVEQIIPLCAEAVLYFLVNGLAKTMNHYNKKMEIGNKE